MVVLEYFLIYLTFAVATGVHGQLVSGNVQNAKEHPYFVQIKSKNNNNVHCSGAIIGPTEVMTLPSCVVQPTVNKYEVYAGNIEFNKGTKYDVKKVDKHPNKYDISIITIQGTFTWSDTIKKIDLPENENFLPVEELVTIVGFATGTAKKRNLKYVTIRVKSDADCKKHSNTALQQWTFCGEFNKSYETCNMEHGSPIIYDGLLFGLNKMNDEVCGKWQNLNVYNQVAYSCDWHLNRTENYGQKHATAKWDDQCELSDEGFYNWAIYDYSYEVRICNGFCDAENTVCVALPLDQYYFLTTASCLTNKASNVMIGNERYSMKKIIYGAHLLPYFTNSKFDLAIVEVNDALRINRQFYSYNVLSAFEHSLPSTLILVKYSFLETNVLTLIPYGVHVLGANDCAKSLSSMTPFKIVPEYFCIYMSCENDFIDLEGSCSEKEGSPLLDMTGELVGIVIWQRICKTHNISIALRSAAFIESYHNTMLYPQPH